jgi:hypothetical protein
MDFTLKTYHLLLQSLQSADFSFVTFHEYLESEKLKVKREKLGNASDINPSGFQLRASSTKQIILRHDVDLLPQNSLAFARIQHEMGIRGSYYFRAVPESWDEAVIKEIHSLGHEIGYHYEDIDLVVKSEKLKVKRKEQVNSEKLKWNSEEDGWKLEVGSWKEEGVNNPKPVTRNRKPETPQSQLTTYNSQLIDPALLSFQHNLEKLRQLVPVTTICMHGSPRSRYDNRDLWTKYNYRDYDIIGEPYFDADFNNMFYLTDTGRRWDGWRVSIRDKMPQQEEWVRRGLVFRSTDDIIAAARQNKLPGQIMMTFHPQRWTGKPLPWLKELVLQRVKNVVKGVLVYRKFGVRSLGFEGLDI